jgi:hypothetical protein
MIEIKKPHYSFESSPDALVFEFDSISENKIIRKAVIYEDIHGYENLVQLGFGDITEHGEIDFITVSRNKDRDKILATVAQTMVVFFEKYPNKKLYFRGSTDTRTRLYRSLISKFIEVVEPYFIVIGLKQDGTPEKFILNQDYNAFIIYQYGTE